MSENKVTWYREMFSGPNGRISSMRVMSMIGLLTGCTAIMAVAFGLSTADLTTPLSILFGGIYGGKAFQSRSESAS